MEPGYRVLMVDVARAAGVPGPGQAGGPEGGHHLVARGALPPHGLVEEAATVQQ